MIRVLSLYEKKVLFINAIWHMVWLTSSSLCLLLPPSFDSLFSLLSCLCLSLSSYLCNLKTKFTYSTQFIFCMPSISLALKTQYIYHNSKDRNYLKQQIPIFPHPTKKSYFKHFKALRKSWTCSSQFSSWYKHKNAILCNRLEKILH